MAEPLEGRDDEVRGVVLVVEPLLRDNVPEDNLLPGTSDHQALDDIAVAQCLAELLVALPALGEVDGRLDEILPTSYTAGCDVEVVQSNDWDEAAA